MSDEALPEYRRIEWQGVLVSYRRLSDGAFIPIADDNADYCRLAKRMAEGYEPLPFEAGGA